MKGRIRRSQPVKVAFVSYVFVIVLCIFVFVLYVFVIMIWLPVAVQIRRRSRQPVKAAPPNIDFCLLRLLLVFWLGVQKIWLGVQKIWMGVQKNWMGIQKDGKEWLEWDAVKEPGGEKIFKYLRYCISVTERKPFEGSVQALNFKKLCNKLLFWKNIVSQKL